MDQEIEEHIRSLSDIELLEYTKMDTYLPEALDYARQELAKRRLEPDQLTALENELLSEALLAKEIEKKPLSNFWRISVFLCGLFFGLPLIIFIPVWLRLQDQGARRKQKEMWIIGLIGLALGILATVLGLPPWSWLARSTG